MAKKKCVTTVGVIWLTCFFLLVMTQGASADITASIRLNKPTYEQGEQVSVWITLKVTEGVSTDDHFFQKKFERLLDVQDPSGKGIPPIIGDHDDSLPIPPTKDTAWLESGIYEVKLLNLWDHYQDPGRTGAFTLQFRLSMTIYDPKGLSVPVERVVESNIEKFIIFKEETVSLRCDPDPLNHAKTPTWVTCYITNFPEGYGPADAIIDTFQLYNDNDPPDHVSTNWGDIQGEDILMLKFPGPETSDMMGPPKELLTIIGWLGEWVRCSGTDTIQVKVK